ncbi:MAG TPA: acyl-CoA dehydrogenase family protein [Caulobacterales bacterium]|nr:acyl-CoA dehydrogenase family protein [Caulobacterales bacterium]
MNFQDSPAEAAYRARARAWLEKNAKPRASNVRGRLDQPGDAAHVARAKAWQRLKSDAGYAAITLSRDLGGGGGSLIDQIIYRQEEERFDVPTGVFEISLGNCIPTIAVHGNPGQRQRYIRPAIQGEEIWCQLFSEPGAGSDLAAVRTRAERHGASWRVNGQKVWTSGAHFCDFGLLLARTDPSRPKHGGLTMFLVDMKAKAVEVRPIKQMNGAQEFNEVFFTDLVLSDDARLGEIDNGWRLAMTTLGFERGAVAGGLGFLDHQALLEIAMQGDDRLMEDSRVRDQIADAYLVTEGLKFNNYRVMTSLGRGEAPGAELAMGKLLSAKAGQQAAYFAMDMLEQRGMLTSETLGDHWRLVERSWTWGAAMRIAGGSEEILKTLIAERVLGLPQEPRMDKASAFNAANGA